ncbi:zinc-ribbon and DUF3426 domain-containing protein [Halopseudomonas salina]|uniref:Zinc finger/thioredoxin putative domain-containing protein n=1 Tax=Halopseudomonas salina TaxID=1323744 RepID=A0ABQ1PP56_9GAMM|nr:zinc-ribbon and DUF3426 domain-containing protein [Halopseudomonas salina]GGD00235.1 hypothetical protein GCM10007418_19430 [Halopseudomonas salina]
MSELLVAQCPFCQTRFRLSQEHLQAAAGSVRCGACLKVFNANLTIKADPQPTVTPLAASAPAHKPVKSDERRDTLMIHDDMDLDDLELDLEALGLDESILDEINPTGRSTDSTPEHSPDQAELRLTPEPDIEEAPEPDSDSLFVEQDDEPGPWDLLDDPEHTGINSSSQASPERELADSEELDLHDDFISTPTARDFELPSASSEGANRILVPGPERAAEDRGIFLRDRPAGPSSEFLQADVHEAEQETDEPDDRREPELGKLIDLPDLVDEPLQLYSQPGSRRSRYRSLWVALSLLAMLGLPAQALYYNFSTLAHGEKTRPYLEQFCLLTGCELPARVDISLIRSSNLMVRPHAEYPRALAIDVIVYNRADFAQPFPVLRMTFNNTRGEEVLSKQFRPDEYLGGELAGVTLMPPQTPVHVALDMLDPGPEAAGYQLDFLSP